MLPFVLLAIYTAASLGLLAYGANCYILVALFLRRRKAAGADNATVIAAARNPGTGERPLVTTQIPLFNEANVAERALRAAAAMDYPADRHEIQVLDDSTDGTRGIVDRVSAELRVAGHNVVVLRRVRRTGYKAGALAAGLKTATGELIAIFDADFVPPPGFLRDTVPFLERDPGIALVQARWDHLNPDDSLLTMAQAIGIDGHFMVEQSARTFNGLMMNFNGTAGVWRRRAIDEAGGWSADTLTEDLDLSYRTQLAGWRTHFVAEVAVPGELPSDMVGFKSQQFRWAKGSIQTAIKLLPTVLRSGLRPWAKVQAAMHLTHYLIHPLMLTVAVLALPVTWLFPEGLPAWVLLGLTAVLLAALAAPGTLYMTGQRALHPGNWLHRMRWMPAMMCLGVGVAVSNSRAVAEAVLGVTSGFVRTPKQGTRGSTRYNTANPVMPIFELGLGIYCAATFMLHVLLGRLVVTPFLFLYAIGFTAVAVSGMRTRRAAGYPPLLPKPAITEGSRT